MEERIPAALAGERIDRVVAMLTGLPRSEVAGMVDAGAVRIHGRPARARSARVAEGDLVTIDMPAASDDAAPVADASIRVPVVYADAEVIVVDKPAGLVVHPGAGHSDGTLVNGLLALYPEIAGLPANGAGEVDRPGIVHRLDAGTSGLLAVARSAPAYHSLVDQLAERRVDRHYRVLVLGTVEANAGVVDAPVGRSGSDPTRMTVANSGKQARTRYTVLARYHDPMPTTELSCKLETGRTHQIRVHLAAIGHPVAGDARYGGDRHKLAIARPFLHAERLAFTHPATGERMEFESRLPHELQSVLDGLA